MTIAAILDALVAIPKIGALIESLFAQIAIWYCQSAQADTLQAISDAAALGAHAQTTEDRYAAALAWQKALSSPRITPS